AAEDLHGGMALLGRRVLIGSEDRVDGGVEGAQDGSGRRRPAAVGPGLGVGEDLPDLMPGVMKSAGNLANAHAVAMRAANFTVVAHRQHPCLRSPKTSACEVSSRTEVAGVGPFWAPISTLHLGPFCAPITSRSCPTRRRRSADHSGPARSTKPVEERA